MSKKAILLSSLFLLLILSGCAKKTPNPNLDPNLNHEFDGKSSSDNNSNINDGVVNPNDVASDTVTIDENKYDSSSQALNASTDAFNSSSDGLKSIYFEFGGYVITSKMQNTIGYNKNVLNGTLGDRKVKLEGNCDEFGTDEYNYALGLKRTKVVKDSLIAQGISADKIIVVSYGESNPQCHEASDSCYARNRRVDLHLIR
ncbi:Outer membrane lipoprotein omp16 precursor [hydrothermal vent metagenome]|uniref:Outer membrane lipoprotein omp16 n=1 Tax=hydrothermal vent metagenome TaxID=652676 RepID=A0A1W1BTN8_9ZZZZ